MTVPSLTESLAGYHAAFAETWSDQTPLEQVRFVVLDCETTGLDVRRHRIVSIGAVAVLQGQIALGDAFEALLRVRFNTAATLVHGITRDESRDGLDEPEAIALLLDYLADAVIVGHHIGHDLTMIDAALARYGDARLANRHIDTGELVLALQADGAFAGQPALTDLSLDGLCTRFGVVPYDRHTAPGDAFLTAQVLLRLLPVARRWGRGRLGALCQVSAAGQ
jgi:DNA polymerase-3 subunit epsilon